MGAIRTEPQHPNPLSDPNFVFNAVEYASKLTEGQKWGPLPEGTTKRYPHLEGEDHWEVFKIVYVVDDHGAMYIFHTESDNMDQLLWARSVSNDQFLLSRTNFVILLNALDQSSERLSIWSRGWPPYTEGSTYRAEGRGQLVSLQDPQRCISIWPKSGASIGSRGGRI